MVQFFAELHLDNLKELKMFTEKQRQQLLARLRMDQIEAESEEDQRENPSALKIQFSESARQSYEKLVSMTKEEVEHWAQKQWELLQNKLSSFVQSEPSILICDRQPVLPNGGTTLDFDIPYQGCRVYALLENDIVDPCFVFTANGWKESKLYNGKNGEISRHHTVIDATEITADVAEQGLRKWLEEWQPALSRVPIEFLSGKEAGTLVRTKVLMSMARAFKKQGE